MRGATISLIISVSARRFQSTLPMRGATPGNSRSALPIRISIHTPHAGSDPHLHRAYAVNGKFQSTLPMRGATQHARRWRLKISISIHTPHAGSDSCTIRFYVIQNISIHTPHAGSDPATIWRRENLTQFQSTLPMRGATSSDRAFQARIPDFNPHSPCGERPITSGQQQQRF